MDHVEEDNSLEAPPRMVEPAVEPDESADTVEAPAKRGVGRPRKPQPPPKPPGRSEAQKEAWARCLAAKEAALQRKREEKELAAAKRLLAAKGKLNLDNGKKIVLRSPSAPTEAEDTDYEVPPPRPKPRRVKKQVVEETSDDDFSEAPPPPPQHPRRRNPRYYSETDDDDFFAPQPMPSLGNILIV